MKRLLWLALTIFLLSGCATSKKVHETSNKQSQAVEVTTNTDTRTVITEKADTTITVPGGEASATVQLDDLVTGKPITAEVNGTSVEVKYDKVTGEVKAKARIKPRQVPVNIERTTVVTEQVQQEVKAEQEQKQTTQIVEKEFSYWKWITAVAIIFIVLYIIIWRIMKW